MDFAQTSRNRRNSLSSIGWRRGPGRGGTLDAPLLGPLPTSASRGEEAEARFGIFAQKNNIFMDSNLARSKIQEQPSRPTTKFPAKARAQLDSATGAPASGTALRWQSQ